MVGVTATSTTSLSRKPPAPLDSRDQCMMMEATKLVLMLACAAVWCGNDVWSSSSTGVVLAARREAEVEVGFQSPCISRRLRTGQQ